MVRFIKIVSAVDKITDCVPIVSTLKNVGILLYQLTHKVNKVANPVNTSWADDIKIHALSKNDFGAVVASIPVIGNLTCLVLYVKEAIMGKGFFPMQLGYLKEATRKWYYGTKKHSCEIAALYLARYPNLTEEKQAKSLSFAAMGASRDQANEEVFKLILGSREWSTQTLMDVLRSVQSKNIAEQILEKCKDLTNLDIGKILSYHCRNYSESKYPIVEFFVSKYPLMDINDVGTALIDLTKYEKPFEPMQLLLQNFPGIKEDDRKEALLQASKRKNKKILELIELHTPGIIEKNLDQVLEIAARNHDISILDWLFAEYKEQITHKQAAVVLAEQAGPIYSENDPAHLIIMKILSEYPNLSPEDLNPVMKKAASHNNKLFEFYLERFSQLEPEHLQDMLNKAVYIYAEDNDNWIGQRWTRVAELIQKKFPQMQAVNPHAV